MTTERKERGSAPECPVCGCRYTANGPAWDPETRYCDAHGGFVEEPTVPCEGCDSTGPFLFAGPSTQRSAGPLTPESFDAAIANMVELSPKTVSEWAERRVAEYDRIAALWSGVYVDTAEAEAVDRLALEEL